MKTPFLTRTDSGRAAQRENIRRVLSRHYAAQREMRRGLCLLSAGQFAEAEACFRGAAQLGETADRLPRLLAACALGRGEVGGAIAPLAEPGEGGRASSRDTIRLAYALWSAGRAPEAVRELRLALRGLPEDAELHFHLGVLLVSQGEMEEAELRFAQVESIDRDHTESLVQLALCCAARHAPFEALGYLQRALSRRPWDPRIGLLVAQAAQAVRQKGYAAGVRPQVAEFDAAETDAGVEELATALAADPDFVDAFLSLPDEEVEPRTYGLLLRTLERALEREPQHAELHYHCGQVLARLGRREDAIARNEQALTLRPRFIRALIELARLYQLTNRDEDALTRLREAIATGAEYADVYYMLGNVHRRRGNVEAARRAYTQALSINEQYGDAREALESLAA